MPQDRLPPDFFKTEEKPDKLPADFFGKSQKPDSLPGNFFSSAGDSVPNIQDKQNDFTPDQPVYQAKDDFIPDVQDSALSTNNEQAENVDNNPRIGFGDQVGRFADSVKKLGDPEIRKDPMGILNPVLEGYKTVAGPAENVIRTAFNVFMGRPSAVKDLGSTFEYGKGRPTTGSDTLDFVADLVTPLGTAKKIGTYAVKKGIEKFGAKKAPVVVDKILRATIDDGPKLLTGEVAKPPRPTPLLAGKKKNVPADAVVGKANIRSRNLVDVDLTDRPELLRDPTHYTTEVRPGSIKREGPGVLVGGTPKPPGRQTINKQTRTIEQEVPKIIQESAPPPGRATVTPTVPPISARALASEELGTSKTRAVIGNFFSAPRVLSSHSPEGKEIADTLIAAEAAGDKMESTYKYISNNILKGFKPGTEDAKGIGRILDGVGTPEDLANPKVIQAASALRDKFFDPLWQQVSGSAPNLTQKVRYISDYYPHLERTYKKTGGDIQRFIHDYNESGLIPPPFKNRKDQPGNVNYDIFKVIEPYVKGARKTAYDINAFTKAQGIMDRMPNDSMKEYANWYVQNFVDNPGAKGLQNRALQDASRWISKRYYDAYIGANPFSAGLNQTQIIVNGYPEFGAKNLYKAFKMMKDPKEMEEFFKSGVLMDYPSLDKLATEGKWDKIKYGMFQKAETNNRALSYFAGKARGLDKGLTGASLEKHILDGVRKTQFSYGKGSVIPYITKHPLLGQFQTFAVKQAEFTADMLKSLASKDPEERAKGIRFLGMLAATGSAAYFGGATNLAPSVPLLGVPPFPKDVGKLGSAVFDITRGEVPLKKAPGHLLKTGAGILVNKIPGAGAVKQFRRMTNKEER